MTSRQALSPHHLGEALVGRLLRGVILRDLAAHDPAAPNRVCSLGDLVALPEQPQRIEPNAQLDKTSPRFDGMHEIDCAIVLSASVIAIELKLGVTQMAARDFAPRFLSPKQLPRRTQGGRRSAGSMIASAEARPTAERIHARRRGSGSLLVATILPWWYRSGMPRGNPAIKLAVTIAPDVHAAVVRLARSDGLSISAWMTDAARRAVRLRDGLAAVAEWEAAHGALTAQEVDLARARVREVHGARRPARRKRAR